MEKGKRKGFSLLARLGGDFGPAESGRGGGGGQTAQPAHQRGTGRGRRRGCRPTCQQGGEGTTLGG
jgi:hypothetical protein